MKTGLLPLLATFEPPKTVGSFVKHVVTDQNGMYEFTNLPDGEYQVITLDRSDLSETTTVSTVNPNISIDFPTNTAIELIPNVIKVGGLCSIKDAIDKANALQAASPDCIQSNLDSKTLHLVAESGSVHPRVSWSPSPASNPNFNQVVIYGNGATITGISTPLLPNVTNLSKIPPITD